MTIRRAGAVAALWLLAGSAFAHSRSESFSRWQIDGGRVQMTFTVLAREVTRVPWASGESPDLTSHLARYLDDRIEVSAAKHTCERSEPLRSLQSSRGFLRVEGNWICPPDRAITIGIEAFVERVRSHVHFARFKAGGESRVEHLFTNEQHTWKVPLARIREPDSTSPEARVTPWVDFIGLGIRHISSGLDHVAFLIGLVLMCKRLRELGFVITGFTLGHSLALATAVLGRLEPDPKVIQASIGFTIAVVAVENIARDTGKTAAVGLAAALVLAAMTVLGLQGFGNLTPMVTGGFAIFVVFYLRLAAESGRGIQIRTTLTALFGLVHGFGFANALIRADLPPQRLAAALFGFNLGVEIGQILLVCILVGAGAVWVRTRIGPSRPIPEDLASTALCGLGLYWFVSRAYL